MTERVEEAGATVRRALGSLLDAARARAPQHPWAAATSQPTDAGALTADQQTRAADADGPASGGTHRTEPRPTDAPATDAGPPPVDHDANLASHGTSLSDPDTSLADPDTAVTDHDTSVTDIDPSLPEPNVASGVDEAGAVG